MSAAEELRSNLIWATRGYSWGTRFLLDGGLEDPLWEYESVFSGLEDNLSAFRRTSDKLAVRFPDPEGRRDSSRRVIFHEFVVLNSSESSIGSVDDAIGQLWPLVEGFYQSAWNAENPPTFELFD